MSITTVRLPDEVELKIEEIAEREQRSKSWVIKQAITEYIARDAVESDRWTQTLVALEQLANGDVVPGDDVVAWIRSWKTPGERPTPNPTTRRTRR